MNIVRKELNFFIFRGLKDRIRLYNWWDRMCLNLISVKFWVEANVKRISKLLLVELFLMYLFIK